MRTLALELGFSVIDIEFWLKVLA